MGCSVELVLSDSHQGLGKRVFVSERRVIHRRLSPTQLSPIELVLKDEPAKGNFPPVLDTYRCQGVLRYMQ
jgi:hypothetical protein